MGKLAKLVNWSDWVNCAGRAADTEKSSCSGCAKPIESQGQNDCAEETGGSGYPNLSGAGHTHAAGGNASADRSNPCETDYSVR
jgi:hypothetical protein